MSSPVSVSTPRPRVTPIPSLSHNRSNGWTPSWSLIRSTLRNVRFRSPRSTAPTNVRCHPTSSPNRSWDKPNSRRTRRRFSPTVRWSRPSTPPRLTSRYRSVDRQIGSTWSRRGPRRTPRGGTGGTDACRHAALNDRDQPGVGQSISAATSDPRTSSKSLLSTSTNPAPSSSRASQVRVEVAGSAMTGSSTP